MDILTDEIQDKLKFKLLLKSSKNLDGGDQEDDGVLTPEELLAIEDLVLLASNTVDLSTVLPCQDTKLYL